MSQTGLARIIHESDADSRLGRFSDGFLARSAAVNEKRRPTRQRAGAGDVFGRHATHLSPSRAFEFVSAAASGREWLCNCQPLGLERAMPGQAEHDAPS